MFPPEALNNIVSLTNVELGGKRKKETTKGEIVKSFGVIVLGTRFEFSNRADLWSRRSISKYIDTPKFGEKTGMRHRFDELFTSIRNSNELDTHSEGMSHEKYKWMLVDDFVDEFNNHRASKYYPSEWICADESISRWYGLDDQ